ncbi:large ribosomal subunit protein mL43 [Paroedura picta]|uniref:large ribosomal subunit protein mL43 n=1 Tax=Paroedura picta TaxID=143630 RepID=UPI001014306D
MTSRGTPSRFLTSVLRNGVGRYVCQLQRLTLTLSRDATSARGARDYIEEKVVDFARQNPGIVLYVCPKRSTIPTLEAEYLNGTVEVKTLTRKSADEIAEIIQLLANQSGLEIIRIRKPFHTDNPSIQGQWHPFTNKPSVINVQEIGQQCLSSPQK